MNNKKLKSNLRFTYAELEAFAEKLKESVHKDLIPLSRYGVDNEEIDELDALLEKFRSLPTDRDMQVGKVLVSKRKKDITKLLVRYLSDIDLRIYSITGKDSEIYQDFKIKSLSTLRDKKIIEEAIRIKDLVLLHRELIKRRGYTKDDFSNFKKCIADLQKAVDDYKKSVERRKKYALKRKKAANDLYEKMVMLSELGKKYWKMQDNTLKYNVYVMYPIRRKKNEIQKKDKLEMSH